MAGLRDMFPPVQSWRAQWNWALVLMGFYGIAAGVLAAHIFVAVAADKANFRTAVGVFLVFWALREAHYKWKFVRLLSRRWASRRREIGMACAA